MSSGSAGLSSRTSSHVRSTRAWGIALFPKTRDVRHWSMYSLSLISESHFVVITSDVSSFFLQRPGSIILRHRNLYIMCIISIAVIRTRWLAPAGSSFCSLSLSKHSTLRIVPIVRGGGATPFFKNCSSARLQAILWPGSSHSVRICFSVSGTPHALAYWPRVTCWVKLPQVDILYIMHKETGQEQLGACTYGAEPRYHGRRRSFEYFAEGGEHTTGSRLLNCSLEARRRASKASAGGAAGISESARLPRAFRSCGTSTTIAGASTFLEMHILVREASPGARRVLRFRRLTWTATTSAATPGKKDKYPFSKVPADRDGYRDSEPYITQGRTPAKAPSLSTCFPRFEIRTSQKLPGEMATFATLRALHTLIGDALTDIERVYNAPPSGGTPLDYPSLDVPCYKGSPQPDAERLTLDPVVVAASNQIVAACGQLSATLHKPFLQLSEAHMGSIVASCIGFAEASHTVEILREAGPDGLHTLDIAARVEDLRRAVDPNVTPLDPGKISHILRFLATHHWFREVRPDVFANNRLSAMVDSGKSVDAIREAPGKKYDDTDGVASYVSIQTDEHFKAIAYLVDQLLPERERSVTSRKLLQKTRGSASPPPKAPTALSLAFSTDMGYFQWMELPENNIRLKTFGRGMFAARAVENSEHIIDAFPWADLPKDSVVVDVGGGIGSTSMVLAKAYPHLRFVVQDRPKVVEVAPSLCDKTDAELIQSGRVVFLAHDFFEPQPEFLQVPGVGAVSTPAVYLIRTCIHNWPDKAAHKMLRLLSDHAGPTTRLLVVDTVLPHACVDDTTAGSDSGSNAAALDSAALRTLVPDGSPLLPNLGKANASLYMLDILMMALLDAKERTIWELAALTRGAGWEITGTTRGEGSLWGYTTALPI